MSTDNQTPRERIKRMRERVKLKRDACAEICADDAGQSIRGVAFGCAKECRRLLTLIDAQAPVIERLVTGEFRRYAEAFVTLSALEAAVDDLCGEGR